MNYTNLTPKYEWNSITVLQKHREHSSVMVNLVFFFQNEEIFVELDEQDPILAPHKHRKHYSVVVKVPDS